MREAQFVCAMCSLVVTGSWFQWHDEVGRVKQMAFPCAFLESLVGSHVWVPTDHLGVPRVYVSWAFIR